MKQSEITIHVTLDDKNVPQKMLWRASDQAAGELAETKSLCLSLWDHHEKNTLRIDLWTKDMPLEEMKHFYIDTMGGLAQSLLTATGDEKMCEEINQLCERLSNLLKKENKL
ncbi:MAG: gliding motility protein GldC [Candidatus Nephrothrix sp. EaCA]|nr:MAG: gliding motility protein GldC [Candidatus Nephrothrix sp. EaCA]